MAEALPEKASAIIFSLTINEMVPADAVSMPATPVMSVCESPKICAFNRRAISPTVVLRGVPALAVWF